MSMGIAIVGPSGVGKATICTQLLQLASGILVMAPSATTRDSKTEKHGKEYKHVSFDDFEAMIRNQELLEYNKYKSSNDRGYNYYGTLKKEYESILKQGKTPLLDIDIEGAIQSKSLLSGKLHVNALNAEIEEIGARLLGRGSEDKEGIIVRLETGKIELAKYADLKRVGIIDEIIWYGKGVTPEAAAKSIYVKIEPLLKVAA